MLFCDDFLITFTTLFTVCGVRAHHPLGTLRSAPARLRWPKGTRSRSLVCSRACGVDLGYSALNYIWSYGRRAGP